MSTARYDLRPRQMRALILLLVLLPFIPTVLALRFMRDADRSARAETREQMTKIYSDHLHALDSYRDTALAHRFPVRIDDDLDPAAAFSRILSAGGAGLALLDENGNLVYPTKDTAPADTGVGGLGSAYKNTLALFGSGAIRPEHLAEGSWVSVLSGKYFARKTTYGGAQQVVIVEGTPLQAILREFYRAAFGADVELEVRAPHEGRPARREADLLVSLGLEPRLPGWEIFLYTSGRSDLHPAPSESVALYVRVGIVMIGVILAISIAAGITLSRQLRLHELRTTALAAVAHELKTPVASTRALVETLLGGRLKDPAKTSEYLNLVALENRRLAQTIERFLLLSRMEQREYHFAFIKIAPAEIVHEALDTLRVRLEEEGFEVRVDISPQLREIEADRKAMVTLLINLVENAIKYSEHQKELDISVRQSGDATLFEFADRGIGIAPEDAEAIFEPFRQADSRLSRTREGAGLGLSIVRKISMAHGGHASARPRVGGGVVITVLIPVRQAAARRVLKWFRFLR